MLQPHGTALLDMRPTEWLYFYSNNPTYPISTDIQCVYIIYIYIDTERVCFVEYDFLPSEASGKSYQRAEGCQ